MSVSLFSVGHDLIKIFEFSLFIIKLATVLFVWYLCSITQNVKRITKQKVICLKNIPNDYPLNV